MKLGKKIHTERQTATPNKQVKYIQTGIEVQYVKTDVWARQRDRQTINGLE